ncbi:hypothetical protein NDU88_004085 [Pleurodeles waltl]|uniref:Uncharacterized protein n=1 Tax=Pleurodeles waltl TaxID=8319 RepID=A0AAV7PE05_PLEWA|nr:hypothetical protein NDU88_004085 [Pleurodeles waltl]
MQGERAEEGSADAEGGGMFIHLDDDCVGQDIGLELVSEKGFPCTLDLCYRSQEDFSWEVVYPGELMMTLKLREEVKAGPRATSQMSSDWMAHTQGENIMEAVTVGGWTDL